MTTRTIPSFVGKITIASRNTTLYWEEQVAGNKSANITAGDYWPSALATALQTAMNGASLLTFVVTFSQETGKFSFSGSGGWRPRCNSQTNGLLTGGHQDLSSNTLQSGEVGLNHLGFWIVSVLPSFGSNATSDQVCANCWIPSQPPSKDNEGALVFQTVDAIAADGSGEVLDFTPVTDDRTDPLRSTTSTSRTLAFELLSQTSQNQFFLWFARTYAGRGKAFRYYPDGTASSYTLQRLTAEGRAELLRGERLLGYGLWSLEIPMERAS